jgi:hypothetical protein
LESQMQRVLVNIKKEGFRCLQAKISSHRSWPQHRSSTRPTTTGVRRFRGQGTKPPPAPPLSLSSRAFLMSLWTRATTRRMVKGCLARTRHTHEGECWAISADISGKNIHWPLMLHARVGSPVTAICSHISNDARQHVSFSDRTQRRSLGFHPHCTAEPASVTSER